MALVDNPVVSPKIRSAHGRGTVVYSNTQGPEKYVSGRGREEGERGEREK